MKKLFSRKIISLVTCAFILFFVGAVFLVASKVYALDGLGVIPPELTKSQTFTNPKSTDQYELNRANREMERARVAAADSWYKTNEIIGLYNAGKDAKGTDLTPDQLKKIDGDGYASYELAKDAYKKYKDAASAAKSASESSGNDIYHYAEVAKTAASAAVNDQSIIQGHYDGAHQTAGISPEDSRKRSARIEAANKASGDCWTWTGGINPGSCVRWVLGWVIYVALQIAAVILAFVGLVVDAAIKFSVVDMKKNVDAIAGINTGWRIIRDVANMSFIFILVFVAIETILGVGVSKISTKTALRNVIIAAILINFSIFFAKVIIDLCNIITIGFYNRVLLDGSLATRFMEELNVQRWFYHTGDPATSGAWDAVTKWSQNWSAFISQGIGSLAVVIAASFSFLAIAWLFIFRYVILVILIVLSPIGIAGYVLPAMAGYAKKWWDTLIAQAIFPVLYMILIFISLQIIGSISKTPPTIAAPRTDWYVIDFSSAAGGVINLVLMFIFMNAALILAKQFAASAGDTATGVMDWGLGTARAVAGYVPRETIGRGATALNKRLGNISGDTWTGKLIGNTRVGNWVRGKTVGSVAESQFGTSKTAKQYKDEGKVIQGKEEEIKKAKEVQAEINNQNPTLASRAVIADTLNSMTNKQVENLGAKTLQNEAVLQSLDSATLDYLINRSELSESEKASLKNARNDALKNAVAAGNAPLAKNFIKNMSGRDLRRLVESNPALVTNNATSLNFIKHITPNQLKDMESLDDTTRTLIAGVIRANHTIAQGYIDRQDQVTIWP